MLSAPETELMIDVVYEEAFIVTTNGLPCCQFHDTASIHAGLHRHVSIRNGALMPRCITSYG
jgi:hypothetical protein